MYVTFTYFRTKDGKELTIDGKRIKVSEESANAYTLTIQNATSADAGVYTCELRNEHGLKSSSGNLNIKSKYSLKEFFMYQYITLI